MSLSPAFVLTKGVYQSKAVMGVRIIGISIEIGIQKLGRILRPLRKSFESDSAKRVVRQVGLGRKPGLPRRCPYLTWCRCVRLDLGLPLLEGASLQTAIALRACRYRRS